MWAQSQLSSHFVSQLISLLVSQLTSHLSVLHDVTPACLCHLPPFAHVINWWNAHIKSFLWSGEGVCWTPFLVYSPLHTPIISGRPVHTRLEEHLEFSVLADGEPSVRLPRPCKSAGRSPSCSADTCPSCTPFWWVVLLYFQTSQVKGALFHVEPVQMNHWIKLAKILLSLVELMCVRYYEDIVRLVNISAPPPC